MLYCLGSAVYGLLAYVPFTYHAMIQFPLVPGVNEFGRYHPYLSVLAAGLAALSLGPDLRRRSTRRLAIGLLVVLALAAIGQLVRPIVPVLANDSSALIVAGLALVPLLWLAAIDARAAMGRLAWSELPPGDDWRAFQAAVLAALYVWLVYSGIVALRFGRSDVAELAAPDWALAAVWSLASQLLFAMAAFALFSLARGAGSLGRASGPTELIALATTAALVLAVVVHELPFAAIGFVGPFAWPMAALFGISLAAVHTGTVARVGAAAGRPIGSGLALMIAPGVAGAPTRPVAAGLVVVLTVVAFALAQATAVLDWNYLVQKLAVLATWLLAFALFYASVRPGRAVSSAPMLGAALLVLVLYRGLEGQRLAVPTAIGRPRLEIGLMLDRYAGYDVAYRLVADVVASTAGRDATFFDFLAANTNVPHERPVAPVELALAKRLVPSATEKPDVFIFVVDSLRRDYVSAYNPSVTFTPALGSFAAESVAFSNAFTRYGATGLSEPSIWVGGMLLHKQYVKPFGPMNSLNKLLHAEGYRGLLSMDTILRTIVPPARTIGELDAAVPNKDYDLCRTLDELERRMRDPAFSTDGRPLFVYSQPQNIHISAINRKAASTPAGESYPGFYPPYAARLRRLDGCFGQFVAALKEMGRYERSLIVVTADHGDSLGEDGRWGHAYTLFPEIVRVPLIVHLPESMRSRVVWDTAAPAFLTDLTPSLYALLGHEPVLPEPTFGRPLFAADRSGLSQRSGDYLVVSSYGPVYGMLRDRGRSLYVVDAINFRDYDFDLTADPARASRPVTATVRADNRRLIREQVEAIAEVYGFAP